MVRRTEKGVTWPGRNQGRLRRRAVSSQGLSESRFVFAMKPNLEIQLVTLHNQLISHICSSPYVSSEPVAANVAPSAPAGSVAP